GLPDLRGALGLGVDEASWIPTAYNMAMMFIGPFSVYLGGLLGVRRVLLWSTAIFIVCSLLLPFSPNLSVMLCLQVVSGLSSGDFHFSVSCPPFALRGMRARRRPVGYRRVAGSGGGLGSVPNEPPLRPLPPPGSPPHHPPGEPQHLGARAEAA